MQEQIVIDRLKPLTTDQYDKCRESALRRVQTRIGNRPERQHFQREMGSLWTILDAIALIVFAAALTISSVHIIVHMGQLASTSYANLTQSTYGTAIGADLYTAIHQWGAIAMSEGSMILFAVLFGLTRRSWRRWIFAALAIIAAVFVIVANWQSNVGVLESIMPAIFTLGLGLNLERLIVASMKRREEVTQRYLAAMSIYETASQDATKHPDYLPMLRQEIWQKLTSLKANQEYLDAPADVKMQAVDRELARDLWAYNGAPVVLAPATYNPSSTATQEAASVEESDPLALPTMEAPIVATNGNGKHRD
jgi:hypothetical protein